jgi:hypothetical protein
VVHIQATLSENLHGADKNDLRNWLGRIMQKVPFGPGCGIEVTFSSLDDGQPEPPARGQRPRIDGWRAPRGVGKKIERKEEPDKQPVEQPERQDVS